MPWTKARRIGVAIVGGAVLLAGVALIFLPGPAFIVIPAGLAILATEFEWARRWLGKARAWVRAKTHRHRNGRKSEASS